MRLKMDLMGMGLAEVIYMMGVAILFASIFTIVMIWAATDDVFSKEQRILTINVIYSIAWLALLVLVPSLLLLGLILLMLPILSILLFIVPLISFMKEYMVIKSIERDVARLDRESTNLKARLNNLVNQIKSMNETVERLKNYINEAIRTYENTKVEDVYFVDRIILG